MTDVAASSVQWTYRCRHPGCPNRIGPLRTACPEHVGRDELHAVTFCARVFTDDAALAFFFRRGRAAA